MPESPGTASSDEVAFFTVTDRRFFPGTVALLNSLRLTGHVQPLVVLDCGLTARQRDLLQPHAQLVDPPADDGINPILLKSFPHLLDPQGSVVIIDSDMIVTQSLDHVLAAAEKGHVCAVIAGLADRWFSEWQTIFELDAPPRRQSYVNSGFVAFSAARWPELLPQWWSFCQRIHGSPASWAKGLAAPLGHLDQDALNVILMSTVPASALELYPPQVAPQRSEMLRAVRVIDKRSLACHSGGRPTMVLHGSGRPKPWERRAWRKPWWWPKAYASLVRRLLVEPDITLRMPPEELPLWLRPGRVGAAAGRGLDLLSRPAFGMASVVRRRGSRLGAAPPAAVGHGEK